MRYFIAVCFLLVLSGCSDYVTIGSSVIKQAAELCSDHGGLARIRKAEFYFPEFFCLDGVKFKAYETRVVMTEVINNPN